ncbi:MAG: hypothetical protein LBH69_00975, partial [Methanomassiliicoccaceae archaeon]|nr:hypothetical protein [Methanomassiliicoccaceae archaeon]
MKTAHKCISAIIAVLFIVSAVVMAASDEGRERGSGLTDNMIISADPFVPVTNITGIPTSTTVGSFNLTGTAAPSDATNQNIMWSVKNAGTTGASVSGNTLTTTAPGTVTITATIYGGTLYGVENDWASVSAGRSHTVAVKNDGTLWTWGLNFYGQLGDNSTVNKLVPTKIGSDTDWASVSAGYNHTVAMKTNGELWVWGYNYYGQLGDGTTENKLVPTKIGSDTDWASVSAGCHHTVAIKKNGELWAWGLNEFGQLGDNSTTDKLVPTKIGSDTDWASVSVGQFHTVAIKTNGELWAWGYNYDGQPGDGTTENNLVPTKIGSDTDWASVSAGE